MSFQPTRGEANSVHYASRRKPTLQQPPRHVDRVAWLLALLVAVLAFAAVLEGVP